MRRPVIGLTVMLVIASCSAEPEAATTTAPTTLATTVTTTPSTTTATTTVTTAPPQPTTSTLPAFPPERTSLEHGGDAWAVVLAGSENGEDPVLSQANQDAEQAGYTTGPTDCDTGAREAVGLPEEGGVYTISVYLESEADAEAALRAFEARGISGVVALVQTFCMD